jgi:hypothetical protein
MLDIKPVLKDGYTLDGWYKLCTRGQELVTGEVWLQLTYHAIRVSQRYDNLLTEHHADAACRAKSTSNPPTLNS